MRWVGPATPLLRWTQERGRVKIGFIGCGLLGKELLNTFLCNGEAPVVLHACEQRRHASSPCSVVSGAGFEPTNFIVSTRRPHLLSYYSSLGVECLFDNVKVHDATLQQPTALSRRVTLLCGAAMRRRSRARAASCSCCASTPSCPPSLQSCAARCGGGASSRRLSRECRRGPSCSSSVVRRSKSFAPPWHVKLWRAARVAACRTALTACVAAAAALCARSRRSSRCVCAY